MVTFSLQKDNGNELFAAEVWRVIRENEGYFKKFNGGNWQEAVHRSYLHIISRGNKGFTDLAPYVKNLARNILKTNNPEIAHDVYTEDGEIAPSFLGLKSFIDDGNIACDNELMDKLCELYLLDEESFGKLASLFKFDEANDIQHIRIRNNDFISEFNKITAIYGSDYTFKMLYSFFKSNVSAISKPKNVLIKEVQLKESNFKLLSKLSEDELVIDSNGVKHSINRNTCLMDFNPDLVKWRLIRQSIHGVYKIDISPIIDYIYEQIYVDKGVNTKMIKWCGNKYKLTTLGGASHIGLDKEKFISKCRVELVLNLIQGGVNSIVALSEDTVYIKPSRALSYNVVRLKGARGKVFDLDVEVFI